MPKHKSRSRSKVRSTSRRSGDAELRHILAIIFLLGAIGSFIGAAYYLFSAFFWGAGLSLMYGFGFAWGLGYDIAISIALVITGIILLYFYRKFRGKTSIRI